MAELKGDGSTVKYPPAEVCHAVRRAPRPRDLPLASFAPDAVTPITPMRGGNKTDFGCGRVAVAYPRAGASSPPAPCHTRLVSCPDSPGATVRGSTASAGAPGGAYGSPAGSGSSRSAQRSSDRR